MMAFPAEFLPLPLATRLAALKPLLCQNLNIFVSLFSAKFLTLFSSWKAILLTTMDSGVTYD